MKQESMLALSVVLIGVLIIADISALSLHSACNDVSDGLTYIRPTKDGNVIPVICKDGWTMIDPSLNFEAYKDYFSSLSLYNSSFGGLYGTGCGDFSSWRDFWTIANRDTQFRVSKSCSKCGSSDSYSDNVAYYMTNSYFCLNNQETNQCYDDGTDQNKQHLSYNVKDQSTSMCNTCDDTEQSTDTGNLWAECYSLQLNANTETSKEHDDCMLPDTLIVRPSIVLDRSVCTCYKMDEKDVDKYYTNKALFPAVSNAYALRESGMRMNKIIVWEDDEETNDDDSSEFVCDNEDRYLNNHDFKTGTFKITECGTYILSEDIFVNFNAPDPSLRTSEWSPNGISSDDLHWFPTTTQSDEDDGEYPGLYSFKGAYHLGFFSGISIQTDHVTIDLNGYSIAQDKEFYLQQRFFSIIELGDKQFVSGQGPGNFGRSEFVDSSYITIKDGTIGLSSHQGIHANQASHLMIDNVEIQNFDIAGFQCNGCDNVQLSNSKVGPQNNAIPILGRYTHARAMLPRVKYFVDKFADNSVPFYKGTKKVKELAADLVRQMDMIYFNLMEGREYHGSDWTLAKSMFINQDGTLDGGSSYGVLLNGIGDAVGAIGGRQDLASDIIIDNVEIYDIRVKPIEKYWTASDATTQIQGFFADPLDWDTIQDDDGTYIGDVYTDIVFAANFLMQDEFCFMSTVYVSSVHDWVFNNDLTQLDDLEFYCGSDIQSQDIKGAIGLRIDSVQNFDVSNVHIHDVSNSGDMGSTDKCGEYDVISFLDTVSRDIEVGYTGTRAQAIIVDYASGSFSNVDIKNVRSKYGMATGLAVYEGSVIGSIKDLTIDEVIAGHGLIEMEAIDNMGLPNYEPMACSVSLGSSDLLSPTIRKYENIYATNIVGFDLCTEDNRLGSFTVQDSDSDKTDDKFAMARQYYNEIKFKQRNNKDNGMHNNYFYFTILVGVVVLAMISVCLCKFMCNKSKQMNQSFDADSYGTF